MKAERRHELQENELAHWLQQQIEGVKPHGRLIAWSVAAAVAACALVIVGMNYYGASRTAGWSEYIQAAELEGGEGLTQVADAYPKSPAGMWAACMAADQDLTLGTVDLYSDRDKGEKLINKAILGFNTVLEHSHSAVLIQRALFGVGVAYESLAEFEKAEGYYQRLIDEYPETTLAKTAKERKAAVNDRHALEDVAFFYEQDLSEYRRPTDSGGPGGMMPGMPGLSPPDAGLPGADSPFLRTPGAGLPGGGGAPGLAEPDGDDDKPGDILRELGLEGDEEATDGEDSDEETSRPDTDASGLSPATERPAAESGLKEAPSEDE